MDADDRIEAATALWNAEPAATPEAEAAPAAGTEKAPESGPPATPAAAAEPKPGEKPAEVPAEGAKPEEKPIAPTVESLTAELMSFQDIMAEGQVQTVAQLKATVKDAMILYQVLDGKQPPRSLLEAVRSTQTPEVYKAMLGDLKSYIAEAEGGAPAKLAEGQAAAAAPAAPAGPSTEEQQRINQARLKTVETFEAHVKKLGEKEGLTGDDLPAYTDWISRQIGKDAKALKRLEAGKLNDVERLFTEFHNQMVARLERWSKGLTAKKREAGAKAPKIPAGGAPPAPAEPVKLPPAKGAEERIKRATELFRGGRLQ